MTERDRQYDIQIGEDAWIEHVSIAERYGQAVDIDAHLAGLGPLIDRLESYCVAGCCGFDAFDFTRGGIDAALPGLDRAALLAACASARNAVAAVTSGVVLSPRMNNAADSLVFLRLLEHIEACIAGSPAAV
ncbi:DUF6331 family protein [Janthinobacterium sp. BJB304]|uniref:DUF6331 family protein n=1 Tax=Janthinobacterium sp. BJB304 TaxID=1572871 RepID=UPI00117B43FE|nr:DUF6331 family protein [Janthinobacterium sp. BJB304]